MRDAQGRHTRHWGPERVGFCLQCDKTPAKGFEQVETQSDFCPNRIPLGRCVEKRRDQPGSQCWGAPRPGGGSKPGSRKTVA